MTQVVLKSAGIRELEDKLALLDLYYFTALQDDQDKQLRHLDRHDLESIRRNIAHTCHLIRDILSINQECVDSIIVDASLIRGITNDVKTIETRINRFRDRVNHPDYNPHPFIEENKKPVSENVTLFIWVWIVLVIAASLIGTWLIMREW